MSKLKEMLIYFKLYRLHSEYYPQIAFFWLFTNIVLYYSSYLAIHHTDPLPEIPALILFIVVFIILPLGTIYYAIRFCISFYKIGKNQYDKTYTNKLIWLSDFIYILLFLYMNIIAYFPNLNIIRIL